MSKNISVEVEQGEFHMPNEMGLFGLNVRDFRAEIHRDDGSWSYGFGRDKAEAIADAMDRLDRDDPCHDGGE